jgi:hypothetical protein
MVSCGLSYGFHSQNKSLIRYRLRQVTKYWREHFFTI